MFHFLVGSGHTYDEEGEDQTQQGQQAPALGPHQDEGGHPVRLQEDLTVDGGCGAPWWFADVRFGEGSQRTWKISKFDFILCIE